MKYLFLLPFLACGCFLGSPSSPSRPVEFIELDSPRAPEVERPSHAPSGVSQKQADLPRVETVTVPSPKEAAPAVINLYISPSCVPCKIHGSYWVARGEKGNGFRIVPKSPPSWCDVVPTYHWKGKVTPEYPTGWRSVSGVDPSDIQKYFDQSQ